MIIEWVQIQNFQAIGEMSFSLNGKGLVLVQGDNEDDTSQDSNGSGKSSMPDAIHWCLFGSTARGVTGDDVINRTAGKGTLVEITLTDDDETSYVIARGRKHKSLKNGLKVFVVEGDGSRRDISKGTPRMTQSVVGQLIGQSEYVFSNSVYAAQEAMPDLPSMTDKNLKELIEEAAGIDTVQRAYEEAGGRNKVLLRELSGLEAQGDALKATLSAKLDTYKMLSKSEKDWEISHKAGIEASKKDVERAKAAYSSEKVAELELEIKRVNLGINEVAGKIERVDEEKAQLRKLESAEKAEKDTLNSLNAKVSLAKGNCDEIKDKIKSVTRIVGTNCSSCGKPYEESDIAAKKLILMEDARKYIAKYKELLSLAEAQSVVVSASTAAVSDYQASMTDISEEIARERVLTKRMSDFRESLNLELRKKSAIDDMKALLEKVKSEKNPHSANLVEVRREIDSYKKKYETKRKEIKSKADEITVMGEVMKVFSPSGVRAYILDTITPYLNSRTAHYLGVLSDGNISAVWSTISLTASGETREKFAIGVTSATGGASYKALSGGEKRKVKLACCMALQDLVSSRAVKPLQLFMADEIDDSVDESGLERLMTILDEKARERGTVLVISHNSLSDWIRQTVTVCKKDGQSSLIGDALK